jgi:hypothetical protein
MSNNDSPPPFTFIASPDLKSEYANLVRIAHSPVEFVVEFARLLPGEAHPLNVSKVVLSPLAVKMLQKALTENVSRFESTFGEISMPGVNTLADQLFKNKADPETPEEGPST